MSVYLARIQDIDKSGPTLNSIISINPRALEAAEALDHQYAKTGTFLGSLHGVPIVVKDQVETKDVMTTFGSIAQCGYMPKDDATVIKKLKAAGAIILAKTAMPDYATSYFAFCSMIGETKNPYLLAHDPGGSSGGTAAAVAANLGVVGLGEDTGGSIRLPASFTNLVGVRVTPGLISRNGMQPLIAFQDTPGPMTRTVKDAAILLDAIVGYDPSDEFTAEAMFAAHQGSYVQALDADGLKGARLGVVRNAFGPNDRPELAAVNRVIESALKAAKLAGANLIDIEIPSLGERLDETAFYIAHSRYEVNKFLASRPNMPMNSLETIHAAGKYDLTLIILSTYSLDRKHQKVILTIIESSPAATASSAWLSAFSPRTSSRLSPFRRFRSRRRPKKMCGKASTHACRSPRTLRSPPTPGCPRFVFRPGLAMMDCLLAWSLSRPRITSLPFSVWATRSSRRQSTAGRHASFRFL